MATTEPRTPRRDVSTRYPEPPPVPSSFWSYAKGMGPGIVIAMVWLGSGDLVDAAVSGANYGYTLLWALVIALLTRYLVTTTLARYQLCNSKDDPTVLHGFGRLWSGFPILISAGAALLGLTYNCFLLLGSGTALWHLTGGLGGEKWGVFGWSLVSMVASLFLARAKRQYKGIEQFATGAVVVLALTFIAAAIASRADLVGMVKGLLFTVPKDQGPIGATLITISLIGTIGGSAANLLYTYFMRERGWVGPKYRRLQAYDLFTGVLSIIIIDIAIWITAVEVLNRDGLRITSTDDLAHMMDMLLGPVGVFLLWLGIFAATFDNLPANSFGYTKMFVGAVHQTKPEREATYGGVEERDPLFRVIQTLLLVVPVIFSLPGAPNFLILTVVGNSLSVVLVPVMVVGLMWMTNKKSLMLPGYTNKWWQNVLLFVVGGIAVYATYGLVTSLPGLISGF